MMRTDIRKKMGQERELGVCVSSPEPKKNGGSDGGTAAAICGHPRALGLGFLRGNERWEQGYL